MMVTKAKHPQLYLKSMFSPRTDAMATHGNSAVPGPVTFPSQASIESWQYLVMYATRSLNLFPEELHFPWGKK